MRNQSKKRQTGCPVAFGLDTFGDRWSLLIIREIMLKGKKTYSDFLEADERISTNILVDRLKHLEAEGIIEKTGDPENHRRFLYALTQKGFDLMPVMLEIILWSGKHDHRPFAMRGAVDKIRKNRSAYEAEILGVPKSGTSS